MDFCYGLLLLLELCQNISVEVFMVRLEFCTPNLLNFHDLTAKIFIFDARVRVLVVGF